MPVLEPYTRSVKGDLHVEMQACYILQAAQMIQCEAGLRPTELHPWGSDLSAESQGGSILHILRFQV